MEKPKRRSKGTGTIRKSKDGFRVQLRPIVDGVRVLSPWFKGRTLKEAQDQAKVWTPTAISNKAAETVGQHLEQWWAEASPRWAQTTQATDGNKFSKYIISDERLCAYPLGDLSKLNIKEWLSTAFEGASENTKARTLGLLCRALSAAVQDDKIKFNVAERAGLANAPKPSAADVKPFDLKDELKLHKFGQGTEWEALLHFGFDAGPRQQEVFGLRWADINFATGDCTIARTVDTVNGVPTVKRGGKSKSAVRTFRLSKCTLDSLKRHRGLAKGLSEYVFTNPEGALWDRSSFGKAWAKFCAEAQVQNLGFHSVRHSCATTLISGNEPITAVAARLGHANATITLKTYAHYLPKDQERLAAAYDARQNRLLLGDTSEERAA